MARYSLVVWKEAKIPNRWLSATPENYKRNAILGDEHRAK